MGKLIRILNRYVALHSAFFFLNFLKKENKYWWVLFYLDYNLSGLFLFALGDNKFPT